MLAEKLEAATLSRLMAEAKLQSFRGASQVRRPTLAFQSQTFLRDLEGVGEGFKLGSLWLGFTMGTGVWGSGSRL